MSFCLPIDLSTYCIYISILSYLILSYPILSYPILSYPILSYPILSYPILSYPIYLSIYLSILSIYLPMHLQVSKRSYSARLPHFFRLTTPKTKRFCETSFKNGKLSAKPTAFCQQCVLRFFHSTCPKYCACHEKVRPGHTKCCTFHAKSS